VAFEKINGGIQYAYDTGQRIVDLLDAHTDYLSGIEQALIGSQERDQFASFVLNGTTDATGAVAIQNYPRPGFNFELSSYAGVAATGGGFLVYLNDTSAQNLLYAGSTSSYFSDNFPGGLFVPENAFIIAQFTGLAAAQNVSVTIRAKRYPVGGR
jgi:hypothetical protein